MAKKSILLLFLLYVCSWEILASDIEMIEQVFQRYRSALLQNNGRDALAEMDSATVRYYDDAIHDALNLPRPELDRQDLISKLMILRLRHVFRTSQLQEMTGESLFVYAVENNWISKSGILENTEIVNIKIEGNFANAAFPKNPEYPLFFFIKESGAWKLSLWKSFDLANMVFAKMQEDSGLEEDEYLILLLEKVSRSKVDKKILEGPLE